MISERRRYIRQDLKTAVYVDLGPHSRARLLNLSEGGLALDEGCPAESNEPIRLEFAVPSTTSRIKASGQIVWTKESPRKAGIELLDLPRESYAQIREWVSSAPSGLQENVATRFAPSATETLEERSEQAPRPGSPEERPEQQWPARLRWIVPTALALGVLSLAALGLAALGLGFSMRQQTQIRQSMGDDYTSLRVGIGRDFQLLQERIAHTDENNAQMQGQLSVVTKRLQLSTDEWGQARQIASEIRQLNARQLATLGTVLRKDLETKASTTELNSDSAKFRGEVAGVRSDLHTARAGFQATLDRLNKQVAGNREDIERLQQIGQRESIHFLLNGKGSRITMGDVTIELRGTNPKKNLFSVVLYHDQKRLEKTNRALNEPIYFYTGNGSAARELVVNQIGQTGHVAGGYLSVPKAKTVVASAQSQPKP